jgi:hypothetical protein
LLVSITAFIQRLVMGCLASSTRLLMAGLFAPFLAVMWREYGRAMIFWAAAARRHAGGTRHRRMAEISRP